MSAVADARGFKRICMNCGNRFYDLNKRPIICPSCGTEFTGEIKVKSRRSRTVTDKQAEGQVSEKTAKAAANDDDTKEEDIDDELDTDVVSLDEMEDEENDNNSVDGDDALGLDEDDLDDDDIDAGIDDLDDDDDLDDEIDVDIDDDKH